LYHEYTFLEDKQELAIKTKHATARQAATIAKKATVKKLILGHYSSRYKDESLFLQEGQTVFDPVELAQEGKTFSIEN
jgi:ribonuclease Z